MRLRSVAAVVVFVWVLVSGLAVANSSATESSATESSRPESTASIGGLVWHDLVRDGVYVPVMDSPAAGIDIELIVDDAVIDRTTSGADGTYRFVAVAPGTYRVRFVVSAASALTSRVAARFVAGSAAGPDGSTAAIVVAPGDEIDVSAGVVAWAGHIGVEVWDDTVADGRRSSEEAGIATVMVQLLDVDGGVVESTTTDAEGNAGFAIGAGTYRLRVVYGAFNEGVGTDVSAAGFSELVTISRGHPVAVLRAAGAGAGTGQLAAHGQVRIDVNRDGVIEADTKVPPIEVALYRPGVEEPVMTTTTGAAGEYRFEGLDPTWGYRYRIAFTAPVGYRFQPDNWSDRFDERMLNRSETERVSTVLVVGEDGYAAVGNRVWIDNGDGIQTPSCDGWDSEPGLGGIEVKLYAAIPGEEPQLLTTTRTRDDGRYVFFGYFSLDPYLVEVIAPSGAYFAPQHAVDDDEIDSDVDAAGRTAPFTFEERREIRDLDAGLVFRGPRFGVRTVGDTVWLDADGDGIRAADEEALAGVTVELYAEVDESRRELVDATTTAPDGTYELNVPLDMRLFPFDQRYFLQVVAPPGFRFTRQVTSLDALGTDARQALSDAGETEAEAPTLDHYNSDVDDFGLSEPFTIGCVREMSNMDAGLVRSE